MFTKIVKGCPRKELMPIIKERILEGSTMNSDGWKTYDGLILDGYKHHRVYHSKDEFARGKSRINGIENSWGVAKVRFSKFRGIHKTHFYFHPKECAFRFNFRNQNISGTIIKILQKKLSSYLEPQNLFILLSLLRKD